MKTPPGHHTMTTIVTEAEIADYKRLAGEAGLPVAHWVRQHLNVVVGRNKLGVAEREAAPERVLEEPDGRAGEYRTAAFDGILAGIIERLVALEQAVFSHRISKEESQ